MILAVLLLAAAAYFLLGGSVTTGNLSASQIRQYASDAGFSGIDLDVATAIAIAESGGDPNAYNPETEFFAARGIDGTNQGSVGLWQIFQYEHPEFSGVNLRDPAENARAAFSVYRASGNSFDAWSTYKSGTYLSYYTEASGQGVSA